jgi:lipid-A-disaccharide synthase-like uncharacterized protein
VQTLHAHSPTSIILNNLDRLVEAAMSVARQRWVMGFMLLATGVAVAQAVETSQIDPRDVGVSNAWLVFGFAAQGLFAARMLVQWLASERVQRSVVPQAFWWLSLLGGLSLGVYFWRRGDPVGMTGQLLGVFIYIRNIVLMGRGQGVGGGEEPAVTEAKPEIAKRMESCAPEIRELEQAE